MDLPKLQQCLENYLNSEEKDDHTSPSEQLRIASCLRGEPLEAVCSQLQETRGLVEDRRQRAKLQGLFALALERAPESKPHFEALLAKEPKFWSLILPKTLSKSIQASPVRSRWHIAREERKKILESFERARDEQKRLKRQNWSRLGRGDEFEELFEQGGQELLPIDLELCKLNEQIYRKTNGLNQGQPLQQKPVSNSKLDTGRSSNSKTVNQSAAVSTPTSATPTSASPRKRARTLVKVFDFDSLDALFLHFRKKGSTRSCPAAALLDAVDQLARSEALFATDFGALKDGGDQPSLTYYRGDDDMAALPEALPAAASFFRGDDLGQFARGCPYNDSSKKFYCQRAQRFRFLASQPLNYFFPSNSQRRMLRDGLYYLRRASRDFDDFLAALFEAPAEDVFVLVEQQTLIQAMALLATVFLVSPQERNDYRPVHLLRSLRSCRKFGASWTVRTLLQQRGVAGGECELISLRGFRNEVIARACQEARIQV